ncbi:MAG: ABC transporter ATP-binding protein [Elusimicrobia bacterium]|nr:ABC transporter ATP-binding protein [Elusimicrobiota bacterium]
MVIVKDLNYHAAPSRPILNDISFHLPQAGFLAVLGENGAGKTSLLDIVMGFRLPTSGSASVFGEDSSADPWQRRVDIAYLSEKFDLPGDWDAEEFLEFNRVFYPNYDLADERALMKELDVGYKERVGNLSTGEMQRLQIVGALAANPKLVVADEVTAVLDIRGRHRFLGLLRERQKSSRLTTILATNIPEGLDGFADHVLLINKGKQAAFSKLSEFVNDHANLAEAVLESLQGDDA